MSTDIVYAPQQQGNFVSNLNEVAKQGPRAVATYSMALDRMDENTKNAHFDEVFTNINIVKADYVSLFAPADKYITVVARNSDGTVVTMPDGTPVMEQQLVPNKYQDLYDAIAKPLTRV